MKQYTSESATAEEVTYPFGMDQRQDMTPEEIAATTFTARIRPEDADFALEFSEIAGLAASGADLMSAEGVAFCAKFFQLMLGPEYPRFKLHLKRHRPKGEILGEIIQDLTTWAEERQEDEAERPTMPSGNSSPGRARTKGDRASQLAALAGGDADIIVVTPEMAQRPAQPRRVQRKAPGKRRAG